MLARRSTFTCELAVMNRPAFGSVTGSKDDAGGFTSAISPICRRSLRTHTYSSGILLAEHRPGSMVSKLLGFVQVCENDGATWLPSSLFQSYPGVEQVFR